MHQDYQVGCERESLFPAIIVVHSGKFVHRERTDSRRKSGFTPRAISNILFTLPFERVLVPEPKCRSTVIKETSVQRPESKSIVGVNEGFVTVTSFGPDSASQGKLDRLIRIDWSV